MKVLLRLFPFSIAISAYKIPLVKWAKTLK